MGAAALWTLAVALTGSAWASKAAPEMLFVLDNSASMQYRMGAQEAPDCTKHPSQMSRYNAARQMLEGNFSGSGCVVSDLPVHPDAAHPPTQVTGNAICIPGLTYTTGGALAAGVSSAVAAPFGTKDYDWSGTPTSSTSSTLQLSTDDSGVALPYFSYDIKNIPLDKGKWSGASLTVHVKSVTWMGKTDLPKKQIWVYLVGIDKSNVSDLGKNFVCGVNDGTPNALSSPTQVQLINGAGGPTTQEQDVVFSLTDAAVTQLQSSANLGDTDVYFALVPATVYVDKGCAQRAGKLEDKFEFSMSYEAAGSAFNPKFTVNVAGTTCQGEGPSTHSALTGASALNGVLDVFFSTAKFSLIFMDNVLGVDKTALGGWSYAQDLDSYWGKINIGAAEPRDSSSISEQITAGEDQSARKVTYDHIKVKLAAMKPNGGTPLGRVLSDINQYLGPGSYKDPHWASVADDPQHGDKYADCRVRYVTLLTDGGANLDTGSSDGRSEALSAAAAIWAKGVAIYVVAVGHKNPDSKNPPPPADLVFLNALAKAGGTDAAAVISSPAELIKLLRVPLGSSTITSQVLTRADFIKPKFPAEDVGYNFQAMSRFDVAEPMHTEGVFEQRVYSCEGNCKDPAHPGRARVCEVIDYAARLKERKTPRRFYSQVSGSVVALDKTHISADHMVIPKTGLAPKLVVDAGGSCVTQAGTYDLSKSNERNSYRDHLLDTVRSDTGTCRENYPFGAVAYAQPVILEPANKMGLKDPVASLYVSRATPSATPLSKANPPGSRLRPTMAFAATHDGLLHAFRADRDKNVNASITGGFVAGDELWAWLPVFNLRRIRDLKLVSEAKRSYLGGSVVARHTLLDRSVGTLADQAVRWRSVVAVGAGEAGAGYMVLDVSVPQEPQLMWEITPDRHCFGTGKVGSIVGPNCINSTTFGGMGRSTAKPVLGSVFVVRDGKPMELAVAIFPAGMPPTASSVQNVGVDGTGTREIYVVALENGEVIRKFTLADLDTTGITTTVNNKSKQLGYFWSEPACFNTAPGQLTTRCFIGDSKGMMWRMDLSSSDPSQWKIQWFHDAYSGSDTPAKYVLGIDDVHRVPVLVPASVARAVSGRITVVYGTGGREDEATVARRHLVYSVAERFSLSAGGVAAAATADRIWVRDLGDGGRFVGPALIFDSNAYWSSYTVSSSQYCTVGSAYLWGGRFDRPATQSDPENMLGAFPQAAYPSNVAKNLQKLSLGTLEPAPVDVQPVPSCAGGCPPTDPTCVGGAGGGLSATPQQYEVVVGNAGSSPGGTAQTPKTGNQPKIGAKVQRISQPRRMSVITGWDVILD